MKIMGVYRRYSYLEQNTSSVLVQVQYKTGYADESVLLFGE